MINDTIQVSNTLFLEKINSKRTQVSKIIFSKVSNFTIQN